jgi:hypothetical protein
MKELKLSEEVQKYKGLYRQVVLTLVISSFGVATLWSIVSLMSV